MARSKIFTVWKVGNQYYKKMFEAGIPLNNGVKITAQDFRKLTQELQYEVKIGKKGTYAIFYTRGFGGNRKWLEKNRKIT